MSYFYKTALPFWNKMDSERKVDQMDTTFEKSREFIYRSARPLDLARWQFHFEGGSREAVLHTLSFYQNEDGGFGHAIEPDFWNPNSTPIGCWQAANIVREIGLTDPAHPIIQGMLRYLESGADFDGERWYNTVSTNNAYPHAIWWECRDETGTPFDNPTAALAGFILRFAEKGSSLYQKGVQIAEASISRYMNGAEPEMHLIRCYLQLLDYAQQAGVSISGADELEKRLYAEIKTLLPDDPARWKNEYLAKPSQFIFSESSPLFALYPALIRAECAFIREGQQPDGSYPIPWNWATGYPEFEIAAGWWKSDCALQNMLFLRLAAGKGICE